ncbi:BamA/TamA family outer membrane protein [Formicincola oecophyllae]|uniref:BamA/TamA family outer membrane protein n=1 Tax=Formicincola oecophyllae TaxID=2558361 RepID=A0A4Y6U6C6_9PROT|nr:BamA/TamA family outer membrane protein [Formicincola oecophyllae]QDH12899.1 BamA/TamA family outer membrane protein [Formicincola oecophyllae]
MPTPRPDQPARPFPHHQPLGRAWGLRALPLALLGWCVEPTWALGGASTPAPATPGTTTPVMENAPQTTPQQGTLATGPAKGAGQDSGGKDTQSGKEKAQEKAKPNQPAPDAVRYKLVMKPTGNAALDGALQASSELKSLLTAPPVGPFALAGRIREDYGRLDGALHSEGYYSGTITMTITAPKPPQGGSAPYHAPSVDGRDPALAMFLASLPHGSTVTITIAVQPGPLYHISSILVLSKPATVAGAAAAGAAGLHGSEGAGGAAPTTLYPSSGASAQAPRPPSKAAQAAAAARQAAQRQAETCKTLESIHPVTLTPLEAKAFHLKVGEPAKAGEIIAARTRLLAYLQNDGYALAEVTVPEGILHPATHGLTVRLFMDRGPRLIIGPITLEGNKDVRSSYVRRIMGLHEGQLYQAAAIDQSRLNLGATGLFSSIMTSNNPPLLSVPPKDSAVKGLTTAMPLKITFKDAKRYHVSGEVGYSTDLGGRAGVHWSDKNVLGAGQRLNLAAIATGLGGSAQQGLGYDIYADYDVPNYGMINRTLNFRVEALRQWLYSYHQTAWFAKAGFSQPINDDWSVDDSAMVERESITQFGKKRGYFIAFLPLTATFNNTDNKANPIEPATSGIRATLGATPAVSIRRGAQFYLPLMGQAATYFDLNKLGIAPPKRSILAFRVTLGSILGANVWQIPPDQRLYAGGAGTVRGFRYQGVGPQWKNTKYAIGGTSMDAGTIEFRQRLFKKWGFDLFTDAGQVSEHATPGHGKVRVGVGGGPRYFTPIGPIRVDVAVPLDRPHRGDHWELYIGLGENF